MSLFLNQLRASRVCLYMPWAGGWSLDVDVDLEDVPLVPSGKVAVAIDVGEPLLGTVDDDNSGRIGVTGKVRVLGGAGWSKDVASRHFKSDGVGVITTSLLSATAAEVGEVLVDMLPKRLGVDYLRDAGPASSVLDGAAWYVNPLGVTIVGPRVTRPASPSVEWLSWDPVSCRAELASTELVQPGTVLVDPRFGTVTVRDVEQTWGEGGARATAFCVPGIATPLDDPPGPGGRIANLIASLAADRSAAAKITYRYSVLAQGADGRVTMRALDRDVGIPDTVAIPLMPGVPGITVKIAPGTVVRLAFLQGDKTKPRVDAFEADVPPLEVTQSALRSVFGPGVMPVALAPPTQALFVALCAFVAAAAPVLLKIPTPPTDPEKAAITAALSAITPLASQTVLVASTRIWE